MPHVESDGWTTEGARIDTSENMEKIRATIDRIGPIIVEHWFYYGSSAPTRRIFDDFDDFEEYLNSQVRQGDAIYVWSFGEICKDDSSLVHGKYPDENGAVPQCGAF